MPMDHGHNHQLVGARVIDEPPQPPLYRLRATHRAVRLVCLNLGPLRRRIGIGAGLGWAGSRPGRPLRRRRKARSIDDPNSSASASVPAHTTEPWDGPRGREVRMA